MEASTLRGRRIAWVLEYVGPGSGGLQTIFRHIVHLGALGAQSEVFVRRAGYEATEESLLAIMRDSYGCEGVPVHFGTEVTDDFDIAIATYHTTAEAVAASPCPVRAYFVQDDETLFTPMGDERLRATASYRLGLTPITIGRWLASVMCDAYDAPAFVTDFGVDGSLYRELPGIERRHAVCAICQPGKPGRCDGTLREVYAILHELRPDIDLITYGSPDGLGVPCVDERGLLTKEACNRLYNECAVGLCFSSTNPSRIPFEMMAAGLPAVDLYGDNTRYDFGSAVTLATPSADAIATAVMDLIDNQSRWQAAHDAGLARTAAMPAGLEQDQFAEALAALCEGRSPEDAAVEPSYTEPPVAAVPACTRVLRDMRRRVLDDETSVWARFRRERQTQIGKAFVLSVSGLPTPPDSGSLHFCVWRQPDQSDMAVLPGQPRDGGYACRYEISTPEASGLYHVHVRARFAGVETLVQTYDTFLTTPAQQEGWVTDQKKGTAEDAGRGRTDEPAGDAVSGPAVDCSASRIEVRVATPADDGLATPVPEAHGLRHKVGAALRHLAR